MVGIYSVCSIICEWSDGDHFLRGYFNPITLILAENCVEKALSRWAGFDCAHLNFRSR